MKKKLQLLALPLSLIALLLSLTGVYAQSSSCSCPGGGVYDAASNSCKPPSPDCGLPKSGQRICTCSGGYVYDAAKSSCDMPAPNCYQAGSETACSCPSGFDLSKDQKTCLVQAPICELTGNGTVSVPNPFGQSVSASSFWQGIVNKVTTIFFFVVGVAMFGLIFYAGFLYMTDAGNEENAKKAKKILMSAIIGLAIIAFSGFILRILSAVLGINFG